MVEGDQGSDRQAEIGRLPCGLICVVDDEDRLGEELAGVAAGLLVVEDVEVGAELFGEDLGKG